MKKSQLLPYGMKRLMAFPHHLDNTSPCKKIMQICMAFVFFLTSSVLASAATIGGSVTDAQGAALSGVSVNVKGTTVGTITDENGAFSLNIPNNKGTLVFTYVGYETQEIAVTNQKSINIRLTTNVRSLNDVVVVGYGTQKRIAVTGAVSTVKGSQLAETPVPNISNSIAGKVAGVSMRPNGGQPGAGVDIHIRGIGTTGNNQPLVVVDGIIRSNINQIDPTTIDAVTVLKDAAAVAPYGLGGANGVILITTKRGRNGDPTLTLNSYYGTQTPTYYPSLLSAQDYMRLKNEAYLNENPTGVIYLLLKTWLTITLR